MPRAASRLPPGRRGLKPTSAYNPRGVNSRLPPGRRGLKPSKSLILISRKQSPSPRKAWIETLQVKMIPLLAKVAFPPEGVD